MPRPVASIAASRRDRIQRSARRRSASGAGTATGSSPSPLSTRRVAFHSLLAKRLKPSIRLSSKRTSWLDIATDAAHARSASAPYRPMMTRGSSTLPLDLLIRMPSGVCTTQWMATSANGTLPMNSMPVMIIRLTQRLMISRAVELRLVG